MARKRTRERQLRKLAERRLVERARHQKRWIIVKAVLALGALAGIAVAFQMTRGGDEGPTPAPSAAVACGGSVPEAAAVGKPSFDRPPEMDIDPKKDEFRAIIRTSCGQIVVDLFTRDAPVTVNNFVFLAGEKFYDGLTFHRVAQDFVIQGGDPAGDGTGGPGYEFEDEIVNRLKFDRVGLLAMANSGPGTNGSQFFITAGPADHLNGKHTIFGEVFSGQDVVDEINDLATDADESPVQDVYIEQIVIQKLS